MRPSVYAPVVLIMLGCLVTLLVFHSPSNCFRSPRDTDPIQAVSVTQPALDPLTRSEALRQYVRKACKALDFKESKKQSVTLSHLIYDDTHRAIYCYIPKVSCTSWRRVLLKTTGNLPSEENITSITRGQVHSIPLPRLASSKNPEEKLQTYKKFMFVRHPFERVLSAFRDKMERPNELYDFHNMIGKKIEEHYRGTTEAEGHNVTFSEFIRYISEPGPGTAEQRNEHWLPMHKLCSPCSVEYDFIGRMENLEEDADYVLRWLGVRELVGGFPAASKPVNASQHVAKYMEQLTRAERLGFYAKYLPDFLLFDYKFL
ncbi:carbohydrate sulfotransferase 11-like isoform X2 [Eriocheir sinensis]|uniref:carbohydrate sulfotransferase 11-like isoform X2 n=1 Tax=Eriocheir sinensis TaxID=95602 RepID=UPI0021C839D6|nr:carbohydrate sulfotransferase 11-like isoform X2 [Eriocheir sinensis]